MVSALAPWFGSNRMLGHHVGELLAGCTWVGVPFAGGMAELPHIKARTIVVNDLHRHVINLARVVADDSLRPQLVRRLDRKAFHPDELVEAQERCGRRESCELTKTLDLLLSGTDFDGRLDWATDYFVCCWMGRSSKAGIDDEFNGRPAIRWNALGGDSAVRYHSAIRMLVPFSRTLRRCTFETMDAFDFLARCDDASGRAVYSDPPFPGLGRRYKHNCGKTDQEELRWHTRLRDALARFTLTRCVCRFYDHPLIRDLYAGWEWHLLEGRTQSNDAAPEVLLVNRSSDGPLFGGANDGH